MSSSTFFILLLLIAIGYYFNNKIVKLIHKSKNLLFITKTHINYLLLLTLLIVVLIGALTSTRQKSKYSSISKNYENIRTPEAQRRPHPLFDINTYW